MSPRSDVPQGDSVLSPDTTLLQHQKHSAHFSSEIPSHETKQNVSWEKCLAGEGWRPTSHSPGRGTQLFMERPYGVTGPPLTLETKAPGNCQKSPEACPTSEEMMPQLLQSQIQAAFLITMCAKLQISVGAGGRADAQASWPARGLSGCVCSGGLQGFI